ncbi:MAG: D-glycero-alpha-D-manno-heptose-1,7-bisphosphate 7-phosphatase [Vampirovibrionia bacterium]
MTKDIAVFFDRDGTLNIEAGYIKKIENLILAEDAAEAVRKLNHKNIFAILVTNQTGPARGYYSESHVLELNNRLKKLLNERDAYLDKMYYCPHLATGTVDEYSIDCNCRKPKPGMIHQALKDFPEIDINKSYVVGDKATDVELAQNTGAKGILLTTGYGKQVLDGTYQTLKSEPDYVTDNVLDAVNWILNDIENKN